MPCTVAPAQTSCVNGESIVWSGWMVEHVTPIRSRRVASPSSCGYTARMSAPAATSPPGAAPANPAVSGQTMRSSVGSYMNHSYAPCSPTGCAVCRVVTCAVVVDGNCVVSFETTPSARRRASSGARSARCSRNVQPSASTSTATTRGGASPRAGRASGGRPPSDDSPNRSRIVPGIREKHQESYSGRTRPPCMRAAPTAASERSLITRATRRRGPAARRPRRIPSSPRSIVNSLT